MSGKTIFETCTSKLAFVASFALFSLPSLALAQETVGEIITRTTQDDVDPAAVLLAALCYVGGAIMLVSGALSLRKHADNPASEPMGKGITRLLIGAAIMGLPYLSGVMQQTVFNDSTDVAEVSDFVDFDPSSGYAVDP